RSCSGSVDWPRSRRSSHPARGTREGGGGIGMWVTNLKIVGVVLGTLALYTLIANEIPQVQSEVPQTLTLGTNVTPEQLVAAGEKVFNGIGGCPTCHGLWTRAPNLPTDEKGTGQIGVGWGEREAGERCQPALFRTAHNPHAH